MREQGIAKQLVRFFGALCGFREWAAQPWRVRVACFLFFRKTRTANGGHQGSQGLLFLLCALSLPFAFLSVCVKNFADALYRPWPVFYLTLGSVALNAVLNRVFIFGSPVTPGLGLTGAGVATLLARMLAAAGVFAVISRDLFLRPYLPSSWNSGFNRPFATALLGLGLPLGVHLVAEAGAFTFSGVMVGWVSAEALAAHQIAVSCASLTIMVPTGIASALGVRVGGLDSSRRWKAICKVAAGAFVAKSCA